MFAGQAQAPNVVTVYEPGIWKESHVYFVMEWIEGVDGHTWLERPRMKSGSSTATLEG